MLPLFDSTSTSKLAARLGPPAKFQDRPVSENPAMPLSRLRPAPAISDESVTRVQIPTMSRTAVARAAATFARFLFGGAQQTLLGKNGFA